MAISPMQKVTLISSREHLEAILSSVQRLRRIQVVDLQQENQNSSELAPLIEEYDEEQQQIVYDDEALHAITNRLKRINHAIEQLEDYEVKDSWFKQMQTEKPSLSFIEFQQHNQQFAEHQVITETNQLTARIKEIDELLEKRNDQIDKYRKWRELDITPTAIEQFQYIKAVIGTVPNVENNQYIQKIKQHPTIVHKVIFLNDYEYGLVIFYQEDETNELETLLTEANFKPIEYPYRTLPGKKIEGWNAEIQQLKEERRSIIQKMKSTKRELAGLKVQADFVKTAYERELTKKKVGITQHLMAVEGWIEQSEFAVFKQAILDEFGNKVVIRTAEVQADEVDEVPIKLKNNFLVKPFELITRMYALPRYDELDPTPFLMPFYFVFFGMMVADAGYGLLIFILSLLALKLFKLSEGMQNALRFGAILSVSIMIWGSLYGSFFGFSLPFQLINPNEDVMLILGISVALGLIHIFAALAINTYLKLKEKNIVEAYSTGLAWILLLTGFIFIGVGMLGESYAVLALIGKWLAILNALGIVVASCIKAGGIGGLGWGLYDLYGTTSYIGDLVSYTRLMALGLSGGSIALAFNMIIDFMPGAMKFTVGILLFVALHALSLFLSLLSAYVHGARLIFVEFFAKFYNGGGQEFNPLTVSEDYVSINDEKNQ